MSVLTLRSATIKFGGLVAVDNVSFQIQPQELFGLIGPNGAGKTTCFNLVTGVYNVTSGDILFQDVSILGRKPHEIAALGIARTFQNIRLFKALSALENIVIAGFLRHKTNLAQALLLTRTVIAETNDLVEYAMMLLQAFDLEGEANTRSADLPYGSQRRLEIARALATRPKLLLLDEPAAGMNPQEKVQLMAQIRRLRDEFNQTILLIEHDMRVVMGICERIAVLDYGSVICEGDPQKVRADPKVIEAYLGTDH